MMYCIMSKLIFNQQHSRNTRNLTQQVFEVKILAKKRNRQNNRFEPKTLLLLLLSRNNTQVNTTTVIQ